MLGPIAVGFIIFCVIIGSYFLVFKIWDDQYGGHDESILILILIILLISIYCAISGTYLLHLGGYV